MSDDEVNKMIGAIAEEGRNIAVLSMDDSPASGRTYTRRSVKHTASSPGNPPRPDTGTLKNSLKAERVRKGVWRIVTQVDYAAYLEFGTEKMTARPFMGPMEVALERMLPRFFDAFLEDKV